MEKLCFVTTIPEAITSFLQNHISASAALWPVTVVTNSTSADFLNGAGATFIPLPIERKIAIWRDLRALVKLIILFRRERFDLVHPKKRSRTWTNHLQVMQATGLVTFRGVTQWVNQN